VPNRAIKRAWAWVVGRWGTLDSLPDYAEAVYHAWHDYLRSELLVVSVLNLTIPALWILFDVIICLRTGYMTAPFPRWEWWLWLLLGILLAVLAVIANWRDRADAEQKAEKRHQEIMKMLTVLKSEKSDKEKLAYITEHLVGLQATIGSDSRIKADLTVTTTEGKQR
jgi:hypothetical protein